MADFAPVDYDPWNPLTPRGLASAIQPTPGDMSYVPGQGLADATTQHFKNVGMGILQALKAPGDAYAGRLDPLSDEGLRRPQDLAGLIGPGPLVGKGSGLQAGFSGLGKTGEEALPGSAADAEFDKLIEELDSLFTKAKKEPVTTPPVSPALPAVPTTPVEHPVLGTIPHSGHLNNTWIVNGELADLDNPVDVASMAAAGQKLPNGKVSAQKTLEGVKNNIKLYGDNSIYTNSFSPEVLEAAQAHLQSGKDLLPAVPVTPLGQKMLDAVPEDKLDTAYKIYGEMFAGQHPTAGAAMSQLYTTNQLPKTDIPGLMHYIELANKMDSALKGAPVIKPIEKDPFATTASWEGPSTTISKPTPPQVDYASQLKTLLEKHVMPTDWTALQHPNSQDPLLRAQQNPVFADKLAAAKEQGFNTNLPLYKGMTRALEPLPSRGADTADAFWDPSTKPNEPAIFASDLPSIANRYASEELPESHVLPLMARADRPFEVNWPDINGRKGYNSATMQSLLRHVREKNGDAVVIRNISDVGGVQTQYAFMHPQKLRSPFAKFDPEAREQNNLLAARGLPLVLTETDNDPFQGEQK